MSVAEKDTVDELTRQWLEVVSRQGVAFETLGPMLKLISSDQYSGASRIFCELLQNMDDALSRPGAHSTRVCRCRLLTLCEQVATAFMPFSR